MAFPFDKKVHAPLNIQNYAKLLSDVDFNRVLTHNYGRQGKVFNGDVNDELDNKYYADLYKNPSKEIKLVPDEMEMLYKHYHKNARRNRRAANPDYEENVDILMTRFDMYVNTWQEYGKDYYNESAVFRYGAFDLMKLPAGTLVYKANYGFDKDLVRTSDDDYLFQESLMDDGREMFGSLSGQHSKVPPHPMVWVGDPSTAACYLRRFFGGFLEFTVNRDINLFVSSASNLRALRGFLEHRLEYIRMRELTIEDKVKKFCGTGQYSRRAIDLFKNDITTFDEQYLTDVLFSIDDLYCIDEGDNLADVIIKEIKNHPEVHQIRVYNNINTKGRSIYGYIKKPAISLNNIVDNERVINEFLTRRFGILGVIYPRTLTATLNHFYHECIAIMPECLTVNKDSFHSWMNWGYDEDKLTRYKFQLNRGFSYTGDNKFRYTDKYFRGRDEIDRLKSPMLRLGGQFKIFSLNVHRFMPLNIFDTYEKYEYDLIKVINHYGPDIITFQEATEAESIRIAEACGFIHYAMVSNGMYNDESKVFVATRNPMTNLRIHKRAYAESYNSVKRKNRGFISLCYQNFNIAVCHIEIGEAIVKFARPNLKERFKYAADIKHKMQTEAVMDIVNTCEPNIIIGDFNFMSYEPPFRALYTLAGYRIGEIPPNKFTNVYYSVTDYAFYRHIGYSKTDICEFPHSDHNAILFTIFERSMDECKEVKIKDSLIFPAQKSRLHVYHLESEIPRLGGGESSGIYYLISIIAILIIFIIYILSTKNDHYYTYSNTCHNNSNIIHSI
jgi:hypothetical protein